MSRPSADESVITLLTGRQYSTVNLNIGWTPHVLDGAEREQAWKRIVTAQSRYEEYQRKSDREYPVVRSRSAHCTARQPSPRPLRAPGREPARALVRARDARLGAPRRTSSLMPYHPVVEDQPNEGHLGNFVTPRFLSGA
jgi:hypothetical protein